MFHESGSMRDPPAPLPTSTRHTILSVTLDDKEADCVGWWTRVAEVGRGGGFIWRGVNWDGFLKG